MLWAFNSYILAWSGLQTHTQALLLCKSAFRPRGRSMPVLARFQEPRCDPLCCHYRANLSVVSQGGHRKMQTPWHVRLGLGWTLMLLWTCGVRHLTKTLVPCMLCLVSLRLKKDEAVKCQTVSGSIAGCLVGRQASSTHQSCRQYLREDRSGAWAVR